jgi:hypothetical protein
VADVDIVKRETVERRQKENKQKARAICTGATESDEAELGIKQNSS